MLDDFFTSMLIFDRDKLYVLPSKLQPIEIDNRKELKQKRKCRFLPPLAKQDNTFKLQQLQQSNSLKRLTISAKMKRSPSVGSLNIGTKKVTWCSSLKLDPLRPLTASPKKGLGVGLIDFEF
jgi:hypothetical protein